MYDDTIDVLADCGHVVTIATREENEDVIVCDHCKRVASTGSKERSGVLNSECEVVSVEAGDGARELGNSHLDHQVSRDRTADCGARVDLQSPKDAA